MTPRPLQRAIDTHRTVYLPLGVYSHRYDSVAARFGADRFTSEPHSARSRGQRTGLSGRGWTEGIAAIGRGEGDAIVSGVGLFTGGINPRATALLWSAGENSLVDDVRFEGGHGGPALVTGGEGQWLQCQPQR